MKNNIFIKFKFFYCLLIIFILTNQRVKAALPNDEKLDKNIYYEQINAAAAWEITTGSEEVIVAIIDSGVYIDHPDLYNNIWTNNNEIPGDLLDNDNNGYIDDIHGWDFVSDSNNVNPKITTGYNYTGSSHGTFVAGVIAAEGNNKTGIAGISWHSKIMPLRVLDSSGAGNAENLIAAINYAMDNGAQIVNFSLSSYFYDEGLDKALANAYNNGLIIVASAGNESPTEPGVDAGYNLNFFHFYPVCLDGEDNNILGVAAVNENDVKSFFSNFGSDCVDLSAPGEKFYGLGFYNALIPDFRKYFISDWSGTSVATPIVSGAAALVKSVNPRLTPKEVYDLMIATGDDLNLKNPKHQGDLGSRINLKKLLEETVKTLNKKNKKIVVAPAHNQTPNVAIYDLDGQKKEEFYAYSTKFKGGVNLAVGNVMSDWSEEIITAPGPGGGPHLKIFNQTGQVLSQFFTYESNFYGGVGVATIKYNNDSRKKIITVPLTNHEPLVKIYDYQGNLVNQFLAFNQDFTEGLKLAVGDVNGDGPEEIIIAKNNNNLIRVFDQQGNLLSEFTVYFPNQAGVNISFYDVDNNDQAEIITAPAKEGSSQIKIYDYLGNFLHNFEAYNPTYQKGININVTDVDFDGQPDFIVAPDALEAPVVKIFNYYGNQVMLIPVFNGKFNQGLNISTINY